MVPASHCWRRLLVVGLLSFVLLLLDFITGPFILFPITFVFPVAYAAWYLGRWPAVALGVILASTRYLICVTWGTPELLGIVGAINALIRLGVLVGIGVLVHRLAQQQRRLTQQIKTLEGLLPICSYCKSIRNSQGKWEGIECYVAAHTKAKFSHSFCEPCLKQHHPDFYLGPSVSA
jgi:hypothetical protein